MFLLFLTFLKGCLFASLDSPDTGTLIVSYETGDHAERLDRVRFLLISEDNEETMYPQNELYVEALDCNSRTVAIEHLKAGPYRIRFLIPNTDHLFDPVPEAFIEINKNQVTHFNQTVTPRYATLKAAYETEVMQNDSKTHPTITLEDTHGKMYADSITGKLFARNLNPGSYILFFGPLQGYMTPQPKQIEVAAGARIGPLIGYYKERKTSSLEQGDPDIADSFIQRRPGGGIIINQVYAQVTVSTNMPNARWTLLRNGVPVYTGVGPVKNAQMPDGDYYSIVPEPLEGYAVKVNQPSNFRLYATQTTRISIIYERTYGSINIRTVIPNHVVVIAHITSPGSKPLDVRLQSKDGKINWVSQPLPTGPYTITYELPANFTAIPPERFILHDGERRQLTPELSSKGTLHVVSNITEGVFILRSLQDFNVWKGGGREYSFINIPPGVYTLSFSTGQPDYYLPPKEMRIPLNALETKEITATFQLAGKLVVTTNETPIKITIQELGGQRKIIQEQLTSNTKSFTLPEGKYRVTASLLQDKFLGVDARQKVIPPPPIQVNVRALNSEDVAIFFREAPLEKEESVEEQSTVTITANINAASYTVSAILDHEQPDMIGRYSGRSSTIHLPKGKHYVVTFEDIPNYETPNKIEFETKEKDIPLQADYKPKFSMVYVPQGISFMGAMSSSDMINELPKNIVEISAFSIGVYEVTNAQFASWLNQAVSSGKAVYMSEGEQRGLVFDVEGRLLFKTFENDFFSQISAQQETSGGTQFIPIGGKDSFPVIDVTWYGAVAYCESNECRLPTEAEWEKAAGMARKEPGKPLKRFIFGFGQDSIDPAWANYKVYETSKKNFQVLTTPVGFYNGINTLPLDVNERTAKQTHLAKSPYGVFDMSGNVWEWVSDWNDDSNSSQTVRDLPKESQIDPQGPATGTKKIAKGGCYDSFSDGVRVAERIALKPDHADVFTGFRIAI